MKLERSANHAWTAAALIVSLLAAGCGNRTANTATAHRDALPLPADTMQIRMAEVGTYGGRFVLGQTTGPKTFNAIMANETSSTDVTQLLYAGLTDFDNVTQQDLPMLAKTWDVSPDGLTWTWHLRHGAAFSDGHPITSADVLFSFDVAFDPTLHPSIQDLLVVNGKRMEVSAPDSYTVVTHVTVPYALMIPAIGSLRIMPKHVLEAAFKRGDFASTFSVSTAPESLVTSGPFKLKEYVAGEKTVITRNPYWYGVDAQGQRLPYLDEVVWVIVPDMNTAALKFQAGDVDGLDNVKPEDYKGYAADQQKGNYTLYDLGPGLNTNFFWFNLNKVREAKPGKKLGDSQVDPVKYRWFSNPDFRRAVSMAVDREPLIKSVFFGDAVKDWSTMTPGNKKFYTGYASPYDYNPAEAKKLLAKAGFVDHNGDGVLEDPLGHPVTFTLKTNGDNTTRVAMANFIKDDLAAVGIRCVPTPVDFNTLVTNARTDFQYEAILLGLGSAVPPDPGMGQNVWRSSGLTHYWNIKQPHPETPAEAEIDHLMDLNVGTVNLEERKRSWADIEKVINDQCFVIWLPVIKVKLPVRNKFGNLEPSIIPHRLLWNIDRVFLKPNRPRA
jgi:peptide/nickel transport system substrate-binding protein